MFTCVSTADWHLMKLDNLFPDGNALERQFTEIHKPYKYALQNGIKHVVVPGDMSNVPRLDERYLIALTSFLISYDDHVDTHYVLGNHDFARVGKTSMDVLKNFVDNKFFKRFHLYYTPTIKKIGGVYVTFLPYPHIELPDLDNKSVIFAHVETPGAAGDNGRLLKNGDDLQRVEGDYLVSGHLHTHQYLKSKRALYVGAPYQTNFGESPKDKGWVEINAKMSDDDLRVKYQHISGAPEFSFTTVQIDSRSQWDELSRNPNELHRIYVADGIVVPKDLSKTQKNIISIQNLNKHKLTQSLERDAERSASDIPKFGPTTGLLSYLKGSGLTKKQLGTAKGMVKEALQHLGL